MTDADDEQSWRGCQILPARQDRGESGALRARNTRLTGACSSQEFRKELQEAETKDKKFIKRKTALKKIVANITMGNDSALCSRPVAYVR